MNKIITEKESYTHENSRYRFYSVRRGNHQSLLGGRPRSGRFDRRRRYHRPNLKLPLMRSKLQSTHISRMPSSVSGSLAAVHPFRSNASPSICGTPAPPITQASSRTTSRLLTALLTPFFRRFRPGRSQIGSAQPEFLLRSPTPPGLMYATTCSMLRYMKTHRQEKETLRAAVLSMFPICPIRLLPPFPMLPV